MGDTTIEDLEQGVRAGDPGAVNRLREAAAARREARGEHARWGHLDEPANEALVNVTGGTTGMQYLVERIAGEATRLGVPTTRYALLDRRPGNEQKREPYVLGEKVKLRGDEAAGEE